jgi:hypothetical protein
LAPNAACSLADQYNVCSISQECVRQSTQTSDGTCTDRPSTNANCNIQLGPLLCTDGTFCSALEAPQSATGTCGLRRGEGGDCSDADLRPVDPQTGEAAYDVGYLVCTADLDCNGSTCVPPSTGAGARNCP